MAGQFRYRAVFCRVGDAPEVVEAFFRLRKALFVDILGWDLRVDEDREVDQFDTEFATYCALYSDGELVGGFRAIPTDQSYLARNVFPTLATIHPFPQRRDAWEISRFGVLPRSDRFELSKINYALMFRFAFLQQATCLVAVADRVHERILANFGIRSARYGPPQPLARNADGDPMEVVAGEIRIADQSGSRFRQLIDHARLVEISDETLVFGRTRISA